MSQVSFAVRLKSASTGATESYGRFRPVDIELSVSTPFDVIRSRKAPKVRLLCEGDIQMHNADVNLIKGIEEKEVDKVEKET